MHKGLESSDINTMPIFHGDTHFTEPADLWTSRAPAKFRSRVLDVRTKANGHESWFVGEHEVGTIGPAVIRSDMSKMLHTYTVPKLRDVAGASSYPAERLAFMDSVGVGIEVGRVGRGWLRRKGRGIRGGCPPQSRARAVAPSS